MVLRSKKELRCTLIIPPLFLIFTHYVSFLVRTSYFHSLISNSKNIVKLETIPLNRSAKTRRHIQLFNTRHSGLVTECGSVSEYDPQAAVWFHIEITGKKEGRIFNVLHNK